VRPHSQGESPKSEIVLVFSGKGKPTDQAICRLEQDITLRALDAQKGLKVRKPINLLLLLCDFQCSLADCCTKLKFALSHRDTPVAMLKLLPFNKPIQSNSAFSIWCFFESVSLSPDQEVSFTMLRDSRGYSRNLIAELNPGQIASKLLTLQAEIAENPQNLFNLKKSAEKVGLSPSWLSRKFREVSGLTLERYILRNRLCYALWNIISTDRPIKSIALDLGYQPGSFSERFKKEFGVPPSSIRITK